MAPEVQRPPWIPAARFNDLQREAFEYAEQEHQQRAYQRSFGLRTAGAVAVVVGAASFFTALWYKEGGVIIAMTALLTVAGTIGMRTRKTRAADVSASAARLLQASLDRYRREQLAAPDFFHSEAWQALRRSVMERGDARCVRCGRKASAMLVVEHICSRAEAPERALDPENVEIICHACKNVPVMRTGTC